MKLKLLCYENNDLGGIVAAAFVDGTNVSKLIKKFFEEKYGKGIGYTFTELSNEFEYIADGYYDVYDGDGTYTYYLVSIETEN